LLIRDHPPFARIYREIALKKVAAAKNLNSRQITKEKENFVKERLPSWVMLVNEEKKRVERKSNKMKVKLLRAP